VVLVLVLVLVLALALAMAVPVLAMVASLDLVTEVVHPVTAMRTTAMTTMKTITTGVGGAGFQTAALGINQIARSLTSLNAIAALILPLLLTPLLLLPILLLLLSRILPRLLPPELLTTWLPT